VTVGGLLELGSSSSEELEEEDEEEPSESESSSKVFRSNLLSSRRPSSPAPPPLFGFAPSSTRRGRLGPEGISPLPPAPARPNPSPPGVCPSPEFHPLLPRPSPPPDAPIVPTPRPFKSSFGVVVVGEEGSSGEKRGRQPASVGRGGRGEVGADDEGEHPTEGGMGDSET